MSEKLLELNGVTMRFGGVTALNNVNFHVNRGEICALIGPNGAGKTTVFNVITGVYKPTEGDILFKGVSVVGRSATKSLVPESRVPFRMFASLGNRHR